MREMYYHVGVAQKGAGNLSAARAMLEKSLFYDANYALAKKELKDIPDAPKVPVVPGPQPAKPLDADAKPVRP